jgi:hypothetical protein
MVIVQDRAFEPAVKVRTGGEADTLHPDGRPMTFSVAVNAAFLGAVTICVNVRVVPGLTLSKVMLPGA